LRQTRTGVVVSEVAPLIQFRGASFLQGRVKKVPCVHGIYSRLFLMPIHDESQCDLCAEDFLERRLIFFLFFFGIRE
jgi:hypothetical protein